MVIKRYQVILLSILLLPISAYAADNQCLDKTCVDVFTQDNQLIITAQKGAGKPVAASKKPVVKLPWNWDYPAPTVGRSFPAPPLKRVFMPTMRSDGYRKLPYKDRKWERGESTRNQISAAS